jgi:hypothetical protein
MDLWCKTITFGALCDFLESLGDLPKAKKVQKLNRFLADCRAALMNSDEKEEKQEKQASLFPIIR